IGGGISFFAVFVMPKFQQILKDYRLPLPWQTAWLGWSAEWLAPTVMLISGLLVLWMYANAWHGTFDVRMRRANFLRGWRDRIKWITPLVGAAERDRGMADVCFALSAALDVGMPIQTALLEASALQINRVLRHRLIR